MPIIWEAAKAGGSPQVPGQTWLQRNPVSKKSPHQKEKTLAIA